MKTINKLMLAFFVAFAVSCSKDDDENYEPVLPVTMEFANDLSFPELSEGQEIQILFDRPAPATSTLTIEVDPIDATGFTTTPAIVDGIIQLQVPKGATGASFTFEPEDDDQLQGNRTIAFVLEENETFIIGDKPRMEVTIFENEVPAGAGFSWASFVLLENETAEVRLPIVFSVPVPGVGSVKVEVEGEAVGDFLGTVPAMDANNIIHIDVPSGAWEATIQLQPRNNSQLHNHQNIKFKIIEISGPITLGDRQELALVLKDDELIGKLQSVETINGNNKILKTLEYDTNGRISIVRSEANASGNVLTQNYYYNTNGQLTSIGGIPGDYDAFTWENGKIVMSEKVVGFFGTHQSQYEYQNGRLSRRRDFNLDGNRNATETDRYSYTYHSNGNIQTEVRTSLVNGVWQEVSVRNYVSYSEIQDPSPIGIDSYLFPQQQLYTSVTVNENNNSWDLNYTHFLYEERLIERLRNDYQENIKYSYY